MAKKALRRLWLFLAIFIAAIPLSGCVKNGEPKDTERYIYAEVYYKPDSVVYAASYKREEIPKLKLDVTYFVTVRSGPQSGPSYWWYPAESIECQFNAEQLSLEVDENELRATYALKGVVACEQSEIVFKVKNSDITCSVKVSFE